MIRLALATLSLEGFGQTNFDKTFAQAPALGYRFIEFNCWYPSSLSPQMVNSLRERCDRAGLEAIAVHLNGGLGGELIKDYSHKLLAMQNARRLGARRIVTSGGPRGTGGGLEGVIRSLKSLVSAAEELDMLVCLENHAGDNLEGIDDYRRVFDAISSPHVGLCIDTGHFDAAGVDMDALIDAFGSRVVHIHLKENAGKGTKAFTRFGEGTTDNHHILRRMTALGYTGYLTVELSPEIGAGDGRPFTRADLELPYRMFTPYESDGTLAQRDGPAALEE